MYMYLLTKENEQIKRKLHSLTLFLLLVCDDGVGDLMEKSCSMPSFSLEIFIIHTSYGCVMLKTPSPYYNSFKQKEACYIITHLNIICLYTYQINTQI